MAIKVSFERTRRALSNDTLAIDRGHLCWLLALRDNGLHIIGNFYKIVLRILLHFAGRRKNITRPLQKITTETS